MKRKLFITHSTGGPEAVEQSRKLMESIQNDLKDKWHVFIDYECIKPGSFWRPNICKEIATSHAAIVLLDPHSVSRRWVISEVTVFTFRHLITGGKFKLIPVFLDGLTPNSVELKRFEPFQLNEIQGITVPKSATDFSGISEQLSESLETVGGACVCSGWVAHMRNGLKTADEWNIMQSLGSLISSDSTLVFGKDELHLAAAQILHHKNYNESLSVFRQLTSCCVELRQSHSGKHNPLELYLTRWIENDEIWPLIRACNTTSASHKQTSVFALKAPESFANRRKVVELLKNRIDQETYNGIRVCWIDDSLPADPNKAVDYIVDRITETIFPQGILGRNPDRTKMNTDQALNHFARDKANPRVICVLPYGFTDEQVLTLLQDKVSCLPELAVFVFQPDYESGDGGLNARNIIPNLTAERFNNLCSVYNQLNPN